MLPGHVDSSSQDWRVTGTLPSESGQDYSASGLYPNNGTVVPRWTVDWYAGETHVSRDGRFLVRVESFPSDYTEVVLAFYDRGKLLREFAVGDLVSRPEVLQRTVSHFLWLDGVDLRDTTQTLRLRTLPGEAHTFDITTGRNSAAPEPRAAEPREADLGEVLSMAEGERVAVLTADLEVELLQLRNRQCPANAVCATPDGAVVNYRVVELSTGRELHRGTSKTAPPSSFPYFALPMDSDGRTYARFSVHGAVAWCEERASAREEEECWTRVALLTGQDAFCQRITSQFAVRTCRLQLRPTERALSTELPRD
jgi:hypothetical protein